MPYSPPRKSIFGDPNVPGGHQQYHILPFTIDRTNLFVGRVELHVFEPWNIPDVGLMDLTYGKTVGADAGINALASGGGEPPWCVGVERRYDEAASMAIYTYTFEGIATRRGTKFVEYELEFTMEQAPIETHPAFQHLNDVFGPYDSINRLWPPIVTEKSAAVGLQQTSQGGPTTNPMYGITSYTVPGCMFRMTFTDADVDQNFLYDIGTISSPDKAFGAGYSKVFSRFNAMLHDAGGKRDWLKMAPKVRQHGSCLSITEEWMLSGPRGWIKPVYDPSVIGAQAL